MIFIVDDDLHAESMGQYAIWDEALDRLVELSKLPFDVEPNKPPCMNWMACERRYYIREYNTSVSPWKLASEVHALDINRLGIEWLYPPPSSDENT